MFRINIPKAFFILIFLMAGWMARSQTTTVVSGQILDPETGEPVKQASILVKGTTTGISSGDDGFFSLNLSPGRYTLRITSVGYTARELKIDVSDKPAKTLRIELIPEKLEIGDVDVIGSWHLPGRDTAINHVPMSLLTSVSRVTAVEIEKQGAVTLMDALKYVPGGWTENRGRKTKQFFAVRGQKYPYPDFSINGVWQKEFEETGYYLSALDIESVEIVRSGNALVKGLSGLTGVIDIKTRIPEKETLSVMSKYGELNEYMSNVRYGNKKGKLAYTGSASFFGTDGVAGRNGKERISGVYGNLDWNPDERWHVNAGAHYLHGLRQLVNISDPGAANIKNRQEKFDPVRTLLSYVKTDYRSPRGSATELQVNLSHRDADFYSLNIPKNETTVAGETDWEYGFNMLHRRKLSKSNNLRAGVLYNHWVAPNGKRYYSGRKCDVHTWSGVVTSEQQAGRFMLDAGLRIIGGYIEEWGGFGIEGSAAGFQKVEPIVDEPARLEWQSVAGISYLVSQTSTVHYNFAGGTIAPRKGSVTGEGMAPLDETRFQHDLGFRLTNAWHDELTVSAFFTRRNDAIDFSGGTIVTPGDLVMELYENIDKRSYGIEASGKWNIPGWRSQLFANAMLMKGEKEVNGQMVKDLQLPGFILNTGVYLENNGFDLNVLMNYTGPYRNNRFVDPAWVKEFGDFPLGDFVSATVTAGYTFKGKLTKRIFGEVKNIFDEKYMTVAGYPEPGRIFVVGVQGGF